MPTDSPDLEIARQRLEAERERLLRLRDGVSNETTDEGGDTMEQQELSAVDQHPADVATETFEREKDESIIQGFEVELGEIEDALIRIDDGTYGECETCHEPIGRDRLAAVPHARYCVDDQARMERSSV